MGNEENGYNFGKLLENDDKTRTHCLILTRIY